MPFLDFNMGNDIQIWPGIHGPIKHSESITFGHFTIEEGADLPEHSHPHEQWTHLVKGELEFSIGDKKMIMKPGVTAYIPSHVLHSGKALTKCFVIDCFMPVRFDFIQMEKDQYGVVD